MATTPIVRHVARGSRRLRRGLAVVASRPADSVDRVVEKLAQSWDAHGGPWRYDPEVEWEERLPELLGTPVSPDPAFDAVWAAATADVRALGLPLGRAAYGGWDDGDIRLGRLAWLLTRLLRPNVIVETGVGRGMTSRVLLEALDRNGRGHLWSIDRQPLMTGELAAQTGVAVSPALRERWTLLTGTSRRRLPALLREVPRIDLFLHDSMHTTRNVRFELDRVWPALRPGGAVLVDDVERNRATGQFMDVHPDAEGMICPAEDGRALIGVLIKRP